MSIGSDGDTRPYYYRMRGRTLGPFSLQQIRQKATSAQVNSRTDVSRDSVDWGKASDYPEIFMAEPAPEVVAPQPREQWYCVIDGVQQGPIDLGVLQQYVASGRLKATDSVFREGSNNWVQVRSVPELTATAQGGYSNGGTVINVNTPGTESGTNGMAIAGFVCSLFGCTCILSILGLIFSLIAISGKNKANRGLAISGAIISGIWILLWFVYLVLVLLGAIAASASLAA